MAELIQYANGVPGIRFTIDKPELRIGRSEQNNDICVPDAYVSKKHALIEARVIDRATGQCEFVLRDLGSTNNTYVNKKKVSNIRLKNNDMIYLGRNMFRFHCETEEIMDYAGMDEVIDTLELEAETNSQSGHSFSRRLRVLGVE